MLRGIRVILREAAEVDREKVYEWLTHSDLTPSIMGPPRFPDHPIPTWEVFCTDYQPHYFDGSQPRRGRCYIIVADQIDIGVVCYNAVRGEFSTDVDIWLRSESDCGRGFGSDTLLILANYLHREFAITRITVFPSARNHRAIAAYRKAGFQPIPREECHVFLKPEEMEYEDNIVLVKEYPQNNAFKTDAPKRSIG